MNEIVNLSLIIWIVCNKSLRLSYTYDAMHSTVWLYFNQFQNNVYLTIYFLNSIKFYEVSDTMYNSSSKHTYVLL